MRFQTAVLVAGIPLLSVPIQADPAISTLQVALQGRELLVSWELTDAFDQTLVDRIQAGLPTGFTYRFRLYRDHKRWFDNRLGSAALEVVAMYNAVTEEYLVNYKQDDELIDSRTAHDLDELERAMTRFDGLSLFSLPELPADIKLLIRARADLGSKTRYLFIPTRVETPWKRSRKFNPPAVPLP